MEWRDRIVSTPDVCHGQVRIHGTRVMVSVVLANLAEGMTPQEVVENYPTVTLEDVQAAVAYAAELTSERIVPIPIGDTETAREIQNG